VKLPTKYSEARKAIAACARIDIAKGIRDQAVAIQVWAHQAKDDHMLGFATECRKRAERKIGELMQRQPKHKGGGDHRGSKKPGAPKTLAEMGLDKNLASRARKLWAMTEKEFETALMQAVARILAAANDAREVVKIARQERMKEKITRRAARHAEIKRTASPFPGEPTQRFPLVYADPAWSFQTYSDQGSDRSPENHYPVMSEQEIAAFAVGGRPIRDLAHANAALFLWCTSSNLAVALRVMEAWGFTFKTSAVWVKDKPGTGLIFRNRHELLLYGSRGEMPAPMFVPESVFEYARHGHSEKPDEIRQIIERMYPAFGKDERLELFARGDVPGWTVAGYEARVQDPVAA
jgi:N6-adenosine-specific RNA methylase IME4